MTPLDDIPGLKQAIHQLKGRFVQDLERRCVGRGSKEHGDSYFSSFESTI